MLLTILNNLHFAGVLDANYSIPSGGGFVRIYLPGSQCYIRTKVSATIGVGILTCEAGGTYAGYFRFAGFEGRGSAVPLQTKDTSVTAGKTQAVLQNGQESGLVESLTIVATGAAITCMVGGVTRFAAADISANATFTMADGTISGLRKKFVVDGTIATSAIVITVGGIQLDGTSVLATLTMETIADETTLEWCGDWYCRGNVATTIG
jgi:hypothetical protein